MRSVYMVTENLMQSILNASWGIYLVFVFIFIFMKIPKRKVFAPYRRSRGFMVVAFSFSFRKFSLSGNCLKIHFRQKFFLPLTYLSSI